MSAVARVRKDVRAVVTSRTMKHEPTRMEENLHLQEHDVEILQLQEKAHAPPRPGLDFFSETVSLLHEHGP